MLLRLLSLLLQMGLLLPIEVGYASAVKSEAKIATQLGHSSYVNSVIFSPDGATALTASEDNSLKLWDVPSGRELKSFVDHAYGVTSVAFSSDGRTVLSGSNDNTMKLWDVASGLLRRTFRHKGPVRSVAYSPDGDSAISVTDKDIKLWSVESGREVWSFETKNGNLITEVAFSPDGESVVSGGKSLVLRDALSGRVRRKLDRSHTSVAFSPDGKTLLSGGHGLSLWDVTTGRELRIFDTTEFVSSVAFSPDGKFALSGADEIVLWELGTGNKLRSSDPDGIVRSVAISSDGKTAMSSSGDASADDALIIWDLSTLHALRTIKGNVDPTFAVAYSPDGNTSFLGGMGLVIWDMVSGHLIRRLEADKAVTSLAFAQDGRMLFGSWVTLQYWDINSKKRLTDFNGDNLYGINSVALAPNGEIALSGNADNTIRLWDVLRGEEIEVLRAHSSIVNSVAFSSIGNTAISGSSDNTLKLWDIQKRKATMTFIGHNASVESVAFSPDGKMVLSGSSDETLRLWDVSTGRELKRFAGHTGSVASVAFAPDGKTALSGSWDNTLKLWDVVSGRVLKTFEGHRGPVRTVAFSPDGKRALSASTDGTTRLWHIERGEELISLSASRTGEWLALTPRGFFAASDTGADKLVHVVRGTEVYSILQFYEHLHRPDLVAENLKGDAEGKYASAANVLDLESILKSGPVPKIERLLHRKPREIGKANLAVRLTDRGGGIGETVVWRVNGVAQGKNTATGLGGPVRPGRYVVVEQMLHYDPTEKAEIEVVAYNGKGLLATLPLRFTIDPIFGVMDKPKARLFVLAVGVDKYLKPDWRLSNAVNDVKAIGEALQTVGGAFFGKDSVEVTTLVDDQVTEKGIGAAFDQMSTKVQPQDVFILHLSGHGRAIAGSGTGTGWFFLPQDLDLSKQTIANNAISAKTLENWLRKIKASKSVVVLDACESGAYEAPRGGDNLVTESQIAQFAHATGRSTIAAAPAGKAAYEGYEGHGLLTYAMLEAMNRTEGASPEPIDLLGLASHVSLRVIDLSKRQFGIVQSPKTDVKDNFTFGIRQAVIKAPAIACQAPTNREGPTHIVARPVDVRDKPADNGAVATSLARNALVTVTGCEGAWASIARGHNAIGYVPYRVLEVVH